MLLIKNEISSLCGPTSDCARIISSDDFYGYGAFKALHDAILNGDNVAIGYLLCKRRLVSFENSKILSAE